MLRKMRQKMHVVQKPARYCDTSIIQSSCKAEVCLDSGAKYVVKTVIRQGGTPLMSEDVTTSSTTSTAIVPPQNIPVISRMNAKPQSTSIIILENFNVVIFYPKANN